MGSLGVSSFQMVAGVLLADAIGPGFRYHDEWYGPGRATDGVLQVGVQAELDAATNASSANGHPAKAEPAKADAANGHPAKADAAKADAANGNAANGDAKGKCPAAGSSASHAQNGFWA